MEKIFHKHLWHMCHETLRLLNSENVDGRQHIYQVYEFFRFAGTSKCNFIDNYSDGKKMNSLKESFIHLGKCWHPHNIYRDLCVNLMIATEESEVHYQRLHRILNFGNIDINIKKKIIKEIFPFLQKYKPKANKHLHDASSVTKIMTKNDLIDRLKAGLHLEGDQFLRYYSDFYPQIEQLIKINEEKDTFLSRSEHMANHLHEQSFNLRNFCSVWLFRDPSKKHPQEVELDAKLRRIWDELLYPN